MLNNFRHFKEMSKGDANRMLKFKSAFTWKELQINSVKGNQSKRTQDELLLADKLRNNNFSFLEQEPIIPPGKFKAKRLTSTRIKKSMAIIMAHKAFRIKKHRPDLISVAFVKTGLPDDHQNIEILREAFDAVILNDVNKLIEFLNAQGGNFRQSLLNPQGLPR